MDPSREQSFSSAEWSQLQSQFGCFNYLSEYIILTDRSLGLMNWNVTAEAAFGWRKGIDDGKNLRMLTGIGVDNLDTCGGNETKLTVFTSNGSGKEVLCRCTAFHEDKGTVLGYLFIIHEIPDNDTPESIYLKMFDTGRMALLIRNFISGEVRCSPKFMKLIGAEHLDGKKLLEFMRNLIHPDDIGVFNSLADCLKQREPSFRVEYRIQVNRRYIWTLNFGNIEYDEQGSPVRAVSLLIDITERKKLEFDLLQRTKELEDREFELINILDGSSEGSWIWDLQSDEMEYSSEWKERLGARRLSGKALARHIQQRIHPDDICARMDPLQRCIELKNPKYVAEYRVLTEDKGYIWVLARGKIIFAMDGSPLKLYAVSIDISERKTIEQQLKQKEYELLEILDGVSMGSWIVDIENKTRVFSENWGNVVGSGNESENYSLGIGPVHPEDRDRIAGEYVLALTNHDERLLSEYRIKSKDRGYIWIEARAKIAYDQYGKPLKLYGASIDITERKRLEQQLLRKNGELMKKEHELLEVLDCAALGSWIVDLKDRSVMFSDRWINYLDMRTLNFDEQLKKTIEAVHPEDRQAITDFFRHGMFTSFTYGGIEYRLRTPSDEYIWAYAKGKLSFGPQGSPEKFYGVCYDINDRKKTEMELIEKNKLIVDFFTNISQGFRTPLSIILMDVDLLYDLFQKAKCKKPETVSRYFSVLRQNAYRLQRLIGNLLDITKLDAGYMSVHLRKSDIVAVISDLVGSVRDYARGKKNIDVTFTCNQDQFLIPIDSEKMERILLNLLSNSIKHTPEGGHISINLKVLSDKIELYVSDDGEGIPEGIQKILFDRFRQMSTALIRDNEDCGIGLSLTKAIVELMNGKIVFTSTLGKGTVFTIQIPIVLDCELASAVVTEGSLTTAKKVEMEFSDII